MKIKSFLRNEEADVKMIATVVGVFVTLIVSVLVAYNIAASINPNDLDNDIGDDMNFDASNATNDTLSQMGTFYQIAPIIGIVIVAVVILAYVGKI